MALGIRETGAVELGKLAMDRPDGLQLRMLGEIRFRLRSSLQIKHFRVAHAMAPVADWRSRLKLAGFTGIWGLVWYRTVERARVGPNGMFARCSGQAGGSAQAIETPMSLVLVVDDEHGVSEILEAMIEQEGHRVLTADNAGIGLKLMVEQRPDLIFTDTQMPGADGPALVAAMGGDRRLRELPVIAMSARSEEEVGGAYPRYSAFLAKPFRMAEVSRLLRRFLDSK